MNPIWKLEMLGTFEAKSQGRVVSRFRTRRVASLLAYLALHPKRVQTRDEISDLFWPGSDEAVGRRNLRQAIHSLKKVLEPPPAEEGSVLRIRTGVISLNPEGIDTDAAELERLVEAARLKNNPEEKMAALRKAIALYRGDLLPGFDDLWVMNERFRMEDLYLSSLKLAVRTSIQLNLNDEATQFLRLAIAKEPLDESLQKMLIKQYLLISRPKRALEQFEEYAQILSSELSSSPNSELQTLADQARKELGRNSLQAGPKTKLKHWSSASQTTSDSCQASSIPLPVTRFFGRQKEIDGICDKLQKANDKLISILGPAGTGKTRLSIELAHQLKASGWRVWFVPLADINTSDQILDIVYDAVFPGRAQTRLQDKLASQLDSEKNLLILDNFEHVQQSGTELLNEFRKLIPQCAIVVTSRQSLNLEGEVQYALDPLPTPSLNLGTLPATRDQLAILTEFPSIQMLVDRCQAIRPDVQITPQNARHFVSICEKLEGIPLAIEIAAGLSKSSVPSQIVKQLDNRLLALASRRRDAVPRHQSLRAAIDYSYHSLPPALQSFFASLSVFKGGFSVEAVCRVCGPDSGNKERHGHDGCLENLLQLQERSLIQTDQTEKDDAPLRFRLLESFREYGEEQLSDEEFDQLHHKHAEYYVSTQLSEEDQRSPEARARLHSLIKHDYNNYIAAIDYLLTGRKAEPLIKLLLTLSTAWDVRGTKDIEKRYIRMAVDLPETDLAPPADKVRLYRIHATTYLRDSEFKAAYASCERALEAAKDTGNKGLEAECYFGMSLCAGYLGEIDRCIELCQEVLKNASSDHGVLLERTYVSIGSAHWARDEFALAEEAFVNAKRVSESLRDGDPDALILAHIAGLKIDQGQLDRAMEAASEGMRISRRRDDDISLAACLGQAARYHAGKGNLPAAVASGREALNKVRYVGIAMLCLEVIRIYALILCQAEDYAKSAALMAATIGLESMQKASERREAEAALAKIRSNLSHQEFEDSWAKGLAMNLEEAFDFALNSANIA